MNTSQVKLIYTQIYNRRIHQLYIEGDLPVIQSGNNNNGSFFGSDGIWAILLFALIFGNNGWGNGFGGGNSGNCCAGNMMYDINANTNRGFDNLTLNNGINALQTSVSNGFANAEVSRCNAQTNLLQTLNSNNNALNNTISNGFFDLAMANQKCLTKHTKPVKCFATNLFAVGTCTA